MLCRPCDSDAKSYNQPLQVGKPLETLGVGEVVRSDSPDVKVGDIWRGLIEASDYQVVSGVGLKKGKVIKNDEQLPWTNLVGSIGMPSATVRFPLESLRNNSKSS